MTTNDEQYLPDEALLRIAWSDYCQGMDACNAWVRTDGVDPRAEFDRFLARVRRDAWEEGAQHGSRSPGYYPDENPYGYEETP